MIRPRTQPDAARAPLRGICLVVAGNEQKPDRRELGAGASAPRHGFPRRPDPGVLSEAIPLFFIGRNQNQLWVAREAEGRKGSVFLFKGSALRFAARHSAPAGCASMFLGDRFDLDVANEGGWLAAGIDALLRAATRITPRYVSAPLPR
jgi:hypothetical protein